MATIDPNNIPLNIQEHAPLLDLRGFNWGTVDQVDLVPFEKSTAARSARLAVSAAALPVEVPTAVAQSQAQQPQVSGQLDDQLRGDQKKPILPFPLEKFSGAYAGNGFNLIWRPRSDKDTSFPPNDPPTEFQVDDNILELNLTTEQLTFGPSIGGIPNRGLKTQPDVFLGGLAYLQTVQDVTDRDLGKAPTDIHFEPGMWLIVPPSEPQQGQPKLPTSVARMASIPHGTTINAQGFVPKDTRAKPTDGGIGGAKGGPDFVNDKSNIINTTPITIQGGQDMGRFFTQSMDDNTKKPLRIPQDLTRFKRNGTINSAIIKNPNLVLKNHLQGLNVLETVTFEVSTGRPSATLNGGGTANISFLMNNEESPEPQDPIAHAVVMKSKFWIERVEYKVITQKEMPAGTKEEIFATMPNSTAPTPKFLITAPAGGFPKGKEIICTGTQIQYSQTVNLNFATLTWPHVSVATLVPKLAQPMK